MRQPPILRRPLHRRPPLTFACPLSGGWLTPAFPAGSLQSVLLPVRPQAFPAAPYTSPLVDPMPFTTLGVVVMASLAIGVYAPAVPPSAPTSPLACPIAPRRPAHTRDGEGPGPPSGVPLLPWGLTPQRTWVLAGLPGTGQRPWPQGQRVRDQLWDRTWKRLEAHMTWVQSLPQTHPPNGLWSPPPWPRMPCSSGRTPGAVEGGCPVSPRPPACCHQSEWQCRS